MRTSPDIPLSEDEIDELDRFLTDELDSFDISTLDGFFTALLCGPKTIMPGEWMPWVWDPEHGKEPPDFKDEKVARRIMELLMRHMNDIAMTLHDAPDEYQPLLMEYFDDDDKKESDLSLHEWSWGFLMGIDLDRDGWQPMFDEHPEWAETLFEAVDIGDDSDMDDEDEPAPGAPRDAIGADALRGPATTDSARVAAGAEEQRPRKTPEEQRELAADLTATVQDIHAFWLQHREAKGGVGTASRVVKREPIRNSGKVGRNDPCPCGSGRKFKQCHGAAGPTIH